MVIPDEVAEEKRRPTILGFLSGNPPQLSRDVSRVSFYILLFFLVGLSFVVIQEWAGKPFTALLWAFACFSVGALIGFLLTLRLYESTDEDFRGPWIGSIQTLKQISDWLRGFGSGRRGGYPAGRRLTYRYDILLQYARDTQPPTGSSAP
jgi:hypothetical protein